ncbi:hypothetical protein Unana1_04763 [Umbelopsis nana]
MSGNMNDLPILDRMPGSKTSYPFPSIGNPNNTILESNQIGHYVLNQSFPKRSRQAVYGAWVFRNLERAANGAVDFKVWKWDFSYLPFNATIYGEIHHSAELRFVAPGTYRLKLRVLKVFGSRINANDQEEWICPYVRVIQAVSRTDNAEEKTS